MSVFHLYKHNYNLVSFSCKVLANNNTETELPGTVTDNATNDEGEESDSAESKASSQITSNGGSRVESAKPLAFEVPGDTDSSLIKKHPPLRFRKLEEQQVEINQEMINLKQAEAEKRRSAVSWKKKIEFPEACAVFYTASK